MTDIPDDILTAARCSARFAQQMVSAGIEFGVDASEEQERITQHIARAIRAERRRCGWRPIKTAPHNTTVLVAYHNELGKWRIVNAMFVPSLSREIDSDCDELDGVYDEGRDAYFWPEGWYEQIENWDAFSSVVMSRAPTHWMPLPPPPAILKGDA